MDNTTPFADKINNLLERTINGNQKAAPGGLLAKIAQDLIGGGDASLAPDLVSILQELFVQKKLDLPLPALLASDSTPTLVGQASVALSAALTAAGQPALAMITPTLIQFLKSKINSCGVLPAATSVRGPGVGQAGNQAVILYFVEADGNGDAMLPAVNGSKSLAFGLLQRGFINWATRLNLIVNMVSNEQDANLLVTGAHMGNGPVLARTEIGPPHGRQLRMVFNLDKTGLSSDEFESNVAHEFGHALGIVHESVTQDGSQVLNDTLLGVRKPQGPGPGTDLQAALAQGWRIA